MLSENGPFDLGVFLIASTIRTDTQGCGAGLADAKLSPFIDITPFDTKT